MIRIAICDDDVKGAETVGRIVERCCREKEIACKSRIFYDSKAFFYEVEDGEYYDVLLLDIEMPGLNGIELTNRVRKYLPDAITIFVTSYEQYVYKSFEVQPYRFIPKKNAGEMLPAAVRDALGLAVEREGKFYVAENQRVLEKSNREHTKVRKTLKQVYKELPEEEFVWVDRGCIVNLAQIQRITGEGILLTDGTRLGVGRERITELKDRLRGYWIGKEGLQ